MYTKTGATHTVHGMTSGCLCSLTPHYVRACGMTSLWQNGTGVGEVDLRSRDVQLTNVVFSRAGKRLRARYERTTFEV